MKTIAKKIKQYLSIGLVICVLAQVVSCQKENFTTATNESPNITSYLEQHPDSYSEFVKMLQLTGNSAYLDAWGTYTVFAPTNEAVKNYLKEISENSIEELDLNELKNIVRLHIIQDTVSTISFKDGKINKPNVYGQFVTTNVENIEGKSYFIVNKKSKIIEPNIRTGNGVIHGIDKLFTIIKNSLAQQIANDPNLSIFNEAIQATGLVNRLSENVPNEYLSVLAVPNQYYNQIGINSLQDLIDKYSDTGNPKLPTDSLHLNISYKILDDLHYVSDIMQKSSHTTLAPKEIILVKLDKGKVILNEEVWLGNIEKGSELDREISDITTTNGVLHYIKGDLFIKNRSPFPVYWDLQDQPELTISGHRKKLAYNNIPHGFFKDITWQNTTRASVISYNYPDAGSHQGSVNDDTFTIEMRTSQNSWVEFRTPVIVKGRYKVWIGWRTMAGSGSSGNAITATFDGVTLSRTLLNNEYRNRTIPERELEALGYKKYFAGSPGGANNYNCRLMGIIDVETTDRHQLRLTTNTNANVAFKVDMIQFIPIDMDQLYPQIDRSGALIYP